MESKNSSNENNINSAKEKRIAEIDYMLQLFFLEIEQRDRLLRERELLAKYDINIANILLNNPYMAGKPGVGWQSFEEIIKKGIVYVDKTEFISTWWSSDDNVTLVTRPRRFGKTLMLSTVEAFFSSQQPEVQEAFKKLKVWKDPEIRKVQGTIPTIFITFAGVKSRSYNAALRTIAYYISQIYSQYDYLASSTILSEQDRQRFIKTYQGILDDDESSIIVSINILSKLLAKHHGTNVIILIDEYDTPLHEGYIEGYWDEMVKFMREFFNISLKTNKYLQKVLLTGITRIAQNSLFSDFNNLSVYTVISPKYATCFGFTEEEVFNLIACFEDNSKDAIKAMYDGFTIGGCTDIYNPWSIINYLSQRQLLPFWANSGGHDLLSSIIKSCEVDVKKDFERLLLGESISATVDESISFQNMGGESKSIWSLLLASGYLRADEVNVQADIKCSLTITNYETLLLMQSLVSQWFNPVRSYYNGFCRSLLMHDVENITDYLSCVLEEMVSYFDVPKAKDSATGVSPRSVENFYHGLVLGLIVELKDRYTILSNRESGLGRYDVMLIPLDIHSDAMVIEFKIFDSRKDMSLEHTAQRALQQVVDKRYAVDLMARGIDKDDIYSYGIGFKGKEVMVVSDCKISQ